MTELLGGVRKELARGAVALPGAAELVRACRAAVPVAVASNSPREPLDTALGSAGLADCFTHSFAADEVPSPKPAPDLCLTACGALGAAPKRSVAFEDSATGISSARAAGLYVAVVPSLPGAALDRHRPGRTRIAGLGQGIGPRRDARGRRGRVESPPAGSSQRGRA
ncbi:HAD family hydrolase [Streptomyces sp. NPDC090798]|uniref:HAD family hydrolase n=1 Tax=Streptomyces sp. NPDC090798 TaxID=3365968 RepID=UPI00381AF7D4